MISNGSFNLNFVSSSFPQNGFGSRGQLFVRQSNYWRRGHARLWLGKRIRLDLIRICILASFALLPGLALADPINPFGIEPEEGITNYFSAFNHRPANSYYVRVNVKTFVPPELGADCANKVSKLKNELKSLAGISDSESFALTATVSANGTRIVENYPLFVFEKGRQVTCKVSPPDGSITPWIVLGGSTQFDVQYTLSSLDSTKSQVATNVLDYGTKLVSFTSKLGKIGNFVSKISDKMLGGVATSIDEATSKALTSSIVKNGSRTLLSSGTGTYDKLTFRLGSKIDATLFSGLKSEIYIDYKSSLFRRGANGDFDTNPENILISIVDPKTEMSFKQKIDDNVWSDLLNQMTGYKDRPKLESICRKAKESLSELGLSTRDALIARWAMVKPVYDRDEKLKTPVCLSESNWMSNDPGDIQMLDDMGYSFQQPQKSLIVKKISSIFEAIYDDEQDSRSKAIADIDRFKLYIEYKDLIPDPPETERLSGEEALDFLQRRVRRFGFCAQLNPDTRNLAFFFKIKGEEMNGKHRGYKMSSGEGIIPVKVHFSDNVDHKVTTMTVTNISAIRDELNGWPNPADSSCAQVKIDSYSPKDPSAHALRPDPAGYLLAVDPRRL